MSNPDMSEAQDSAPEQSFEDQVNDWAKRLTKGESLPDDATEPLRVAAMAEKRRRDTFKSYTTAQQELKALQAKAKLLEEQVLANTPATLDAQSRAELDELKYSDPEKWRKRINQLESEVKTKTLKDLDQKATQVSELESRKAQLAEFMEENPGFELSDEIIANDIPPRYIKRLDTGELSFGEFLKEVHHYLSSGKVVKDTEQVLDQPSFTLAGGATMPTNSALAADIVGSYQNELY